MREIIPSRAQPSVVPTSPEANYAYASATEESHLRDYWTVLTKRRRIMLLALITVLGVGAYVTFSATRLFTASATIKIELQNPTVTGIAEMFPSGAGAGALAYDYHQTQFALLESRALAATVIRDLKLQSNPAFMNARVISSNPLDRIRFTVLGFLQTLTNYVSKSEQEASRNPKDVSDKKENLHEYQQKRIDLGLDVSPGLVLRYKSFLKVYPLKNTRLVEVRFTTPSPELSQQLANAHLAGFIDMNLESRFELTSEARDFLDKKNTELKEKLERSEAALNRFRQVHGVVSLDKGENVVVDRLVELNKTLTAARAQRIEAESLHRTVANRDSQYLSQVAKEGLLPTLKGSLATLEAERTKLSTTFKPNHPRMLELNQQISETRKAINSEVANVVKGIEDNYAAALAKERALQSETERQQQKALDLKQVGVEYVVLEEEVKVNRTLYESVLKRFSETSVANDLTVSNMRIVERAEKPLFPSSPDAAVNLLISAALGLFLGAGLVFFLEYLDSSVSTPQQAWRAVALSTFGVVPDLNSLNRRLFSWNRPAIPLLQRLTRPHLRAPQSASKELILSQKPLSIIAESYRTIRTALLFSQPEKPPQVILLTSPSQGEGKTVTTLNLAIALAQDGHRILVIDADLRKGCCHARLGIRNHSGLSNILTGKLSLEEGIRATSVTGLSLLSRGICPPNPSDLLGSERMRQILNDVRQSFNFILIDSPPAIAVTDAAVISVICDGVLLVLHGQKTTTAAARQALDRLDAVRAPVLGVVLNGIDLGNPDYAYYHHYYGSDYGSRDEPTNGAGRVVEAAGHEELPEDEPGLEEFRPGTVPQDFFNHMTSKLTDVAGLASLNIREQIATLRESPKTLPKDRLKELFRKADQRLTELQEQLNSSSYTDLSEEEIRPGKLGPTNVPREFFDHMTSKLTEAAGPMAPLIMRDQIALLGESIETFRKNRLQELLESVCKEILNEDLRRKFSKAMAQEFRTL